MEDTNPVLEQEIKGQRIFVGRFTHSLDPKKRLTIPSEWRAQVDTPRSLYVLPDIHEKCLLLFPAGVMVQRLEKIQRHSIADRQARQFARTLGSQSDLVAWDGQGRIRVKDELLGFAGLVDQVLLVGAFDSFELWNPDNFARLCGGDRASIEEAARYVGF